MRMRRVVAAVAVSIFLAAGVGPALAGGNDAPAVPPGHKKSESQSVTSVVREVSPSVLPPTSLWEDLLRVASVVWGGGRKPN